MIEDLVKQKQAENNSNNNQQQSQQQEQERDNNSKQVIFRLKRRADETPLENLILENLSDQYSVFQKKQEKQENQQQINRKKVKVNKGNKDDGKESLDNLINMFNNQAQLQQEEEQQQSEKNIFLRRISQYVDKEKPLQAYQQDKQEEIRNKSRQQIFDKFRNLDKNDKNIVDIQFNKDQNKLLLDQNKNQQKEGKGDEEIEDFYILEQPQNQQDKKQIGEDLWLIDGTEYRFVNYGNDVKPFLVQDIYGQEIVFDETKYSDPEHYTSDSNRSSNPNNTYPSESSHDSDDEEEEEDEQYKSDNYEDEEEEEGGYRYSDDDEMDEETYYMKKQGIKQQRKNKKKKYSEDNDDDDYDKASFDSQEFDYEEFEDNFQSFLTKQKIQELKRKEFDTFDYDQDF